MNYKSMVLAMIEDRPEMFQELRTTRRLLSTVERMANSLRQNHQTIQKRLQGSGIDSGIASSQAIEIAAAELADSLSASDALARE